MQTRTRLTPPERNRMKNKDKNKKPLQNLDLNLLKIFRVVSEEKKNSRGSQEAQHHSTCCQPGDGTST